MNSFMLLIGNYFNYETNFEVYVNKFCFFALNFIYFYYYYFVNIEVYVIRVSFVDFFLYNAGVFVF